MKARLSLFIAACFMLTSGLEATLELFYMYAPKIAHYDGDYTVTVSAEMDIPYPGQTATMSLLRVGGGRVTESRQAGVDVEEGELFTLAASQTHREFTQGNIIEYIGEAYDGNGLYESAHCYVGVDVRPDGSDPWSWVEYSYIQNNGPQDITAHIRFGAHDGDCDLAGMRMTVRAPDGTLHNNNGPFMETSTDEHFQDFTFPINQNGIWQFWADVRDEIQVELDEHTQSEVVSLVVTEWGQSPVEPPNFLNITASVATGQIGASGGGSMTAYLGETVTISSSATAPGYLSEHSIHGYTTGPTPFVIPGGFSTLPGTANSTASNRTVTWTPGNAGTHALYAEAFTGMSPGERVEGKSGWPGFAGGSFGGLASWRITVDVRRNPSGSLQVLDAMHNPISQSDGVYSIGFGEAFYLKINGSDPDGDATRYYYRISPPGEAALDYEDAPRDAGDGYNGSKTYGPFTANSIGDWEIWAHVTDGTAREWASLDPWNENGNGWWSSPHFVLSVSAPPMSVTAALDEPSIEYGQSVIITSAITAPAQNIQWHGIWITAPGAPADHSQAAAWVSRDASGGASTLSGTFMPSSAGGWMIHANGQETSGVWGPGADKTLTVGKTTPTLAGCASITLSSSSALATWHLAAHAANPHNPNAAAPPVTYTIIAGGKGNAPNGTVLALTRVLPSGTYTVKISTPETGNYNAAAQNVTFTVKDSMASIEQLHSDLGFDPDAVVRPDAGSDIEADVYTPAR